ncbi:putative disease resistance protein RGA3 [Phoenix dactylifera]|uniref:Disease resistance protein RGA3 n=1 Tax=Phoenix dactylifera TaxID=42345 RepID=A0A8B9A6J7_PHODC|nr:putative disease resistance protein RGA3 [Phoenix dactylifera]
MGEYQFRKPALPWQAGIPGFASVYFSLGLLARGYRSSRSSPSKQREEREKERERGENPPASGSSSSENSTNFIQLISISSFLMAEAAAVSALLRVVIGKLATGAWKELAPLKKVRRNIRKLQSALSTIQDVLEDAEERSPREKALHNWLRKLKDAAYDADDVVDKFHIVALRRRRRHGKVSRLFSLPLPLAFRFRMTRKIKKITKRLDEIAAERIKFHLREGPVSDRRVEIGHRHTSSAVDESEVIGRDGDREKLVHLLVDTGSDKDVVIVSVVGMGGLGKTTLVKLVYNDERISSDFELRIWICVSEDFDIRRLTRAMIECVTQEDCRLCELEPMQLRLRSLLRARKFLLVLDDVWNENAEKWDDFKCLLRGSAAGSKVIVTTRNERIAVMMGSIAPFQLKVLADDDCWTLFKHKAFGMERVKETSSLEAIGKEIVQKCGGVPLAVKALGSLMSTKRDEAEWLAIRDSEIWRLSQERTEIIPALRLSYDHLPSRLKQCFAYCSLFPKDYEIRKHVLIEMWVAEGFISPTDEGMLEEDAGNEYFNVLLWSSFFQEVTEYLYGSVITCKMHDLVHDLAQSIAGEECLTMEVGSQKNIPERCHYSSLICNEMSLTISKFSSEAKKLRSFLVLQPGDYFSHSRSPAEVPKNMLSTLTHLRVLDLSGCRIIKLPNAIGKLEHLRFLDLSRTEVETLPNSITHLHNLQTLNLRGCRELHQLPKGIKNLSNLRHLDISGCKLLERMPSGMGQLRNLQTLTMFTVGEDCGSTFAELQGLNLIRGYLEVNNLQHLKNPEEAVEAELKAKRGLRMLQLNWKREADSVPGENVENVLEGLKPHSNLEQLEIKEYGGINFPVWMTAIEPLSSYTSLVRINLSNFERCTRLPPLAQLPSLKFLILVSFSALRTISTEFYGDTGTFPSLESLQFRHMPNLEELLLAIPGRETFPRLTYFRAVGCPNLTAQPSIPSSIRSLEIQKCKMELLLAGDRINLGSSSFSHLRKLVIYNCRAPSPSWWNRLQYFTALEDLRIDGCEDLTCLPEGIVQHFSSLRIMTIGNHPNLSSLGEGGPQQCLLTSLRHLKIYRCARLSALPEWLGGLTSLRRLEIINCRNLASLPDGMRLLTTLQDLSIRHCPLLERRCEREIGEDWDKIAHIPRIDIRLTSASTM